MSSHQPEHKVSKGEHVIADSELDALLDALGITDTDAAHIVELLNAGAAQISTSEAGPCSHSG